MTQPVCATPQDSLLHCDSTKQQPHSTYDSPPAVVLGCFTLGAIVSSLHPQWCASVLPTSVPAWAHQLISMYLHVAGLQSTNNNKAEATGCCEHFRYTRKGCLCELLLLVPVSSEDNKGLLCIYNCGSPLWVFTYAAGWKEGRRKSSLLPFLSEEPIFRKSSIKAAVFSYCQLLLNALRLCKLRMLGRLEAAQHPCSSLKFWKDLFTWTPLKCAIGRQRGALVQRGKSF